MQMATGGGGAQIPGNLANGQMGLMNFGGAMQPTANVGHPPMNGNGSNQLSSHVNNDGAATSQVGYWR